MSGEADSGRRDFFRQGAALLGGAALFGIMPAGARSSAYAAGSDAPEMQEVKIGFLPLTDCASVVIASEMGFDRKYGIRIIPKREASWATVRDKLASGELQASQALYSMVYGIHLGVGGEKTDMAVLMTLNNNGQDIVLSSRLKEKGVRSGEALKRLVSMEKPHSVFAQTFPTGTHAMWLYYWMAAHGIDPLRDVNTITVPPPLMVSAMQSGNMDGFCAGEPWGPIAIREGIGFAAASSQQIWKDHPEKVLSATRDFVDSHPNTARAMIMAILEASSFIDHPANRPTVANIIAGKNYVDAPVGILEGRMQGIYDNGLGKTWQDPHHMKFHGDGEVNFPYLSDGIWFMTQLRRWGLLREDPDYDAVARTINRTELYTEAAAGAKVSVPAEPMRSSTLMDGRTWNGKDPKAYADSFEIRA